MGFNLTIDNGNSTVKVVVWHDSTPVRMAELRGTETEIATQLETMITTYSLDATIACSVADNPAGLLKVAEKAGCGKLIEFTTAMPVPLIIDYKSVGTLGVDRLAAAVGASTSCPNTELLIADIGTAATYDIVTADGHYCGGNIAPGIKMRLLGMHEHTSRLPRVESRGEVPLFGVDTQTAMRAGALRGVVAELLYYRSLGVSSARRTLVTGGWGADIMAMLPPEIDNIEYNKYLVNQGLNSILLYNEDK
jgi:type III pantothenate kinase